MLFIGIDPGLSGAIATIDTQYGNDPYVLIDMPVLKIGKKKTLDLASIRSILVQRDVVFVAIESVHAMPGQGVVSMFTFGKGYGELLGLIAGLQLSYLTVTPQIWKKTFQVPPGKDGSVQACSRIYPSVILPRKKDHGKADALLIARYGHFSSVHHGTYEGVPHGLHS